MAKRPPSTSWMLPCVWACVGTPSGSSQVSVLPVQPPTSSPRNWWGEDDGWGVVISGFLGSHPEHTKWVLFRGRIEHDRERQPQDLPRVCGIDHAVVP